jgi:P-type conjugative transfer protein TrbL
MLLLAVENALNQGNIMVADFLALNTVMFFIQERCVDAMKYFTFYAQRLMYLLAGIDLIIAVLLNLEEADHLKVLVKKVIKYGFFIFLIDKYSYLLNIFLDGFIFFGKMSGIKAFQPLAEGIATNPAVIATYGLYLVKDALNVIIKQGTSTITSDPVLMMNIGILVAIAGSFFMIGLNLFLLYVEFYVIGALSVVLIPFGVNQYTSFISQKVLNAMVTIGIKMMVTVFIIGLAMPIMMSFQPLVAESSKVIKDNIEKHEAAQAKENAGKPKEEQVTTTAPAPDTQSLEKYLYLLIPSLAVAFLSIHGPNMAMTLLSGGGSTFNASTAMGSIMAMARAPQTLQGFGLGVKGVGDEQKRKNVESGSPTTIGRKLNNTTPNASEGNYSYDNKKQLSVQNIASKLNSTDTNVKNESN